LQFFGDQDQDLFACLLFFRRRRRSTNRPTDEQVVAGPEKRVMVASCAAAARIWEYYLNAQSCHKFCQIITNSKHPT